MDALREQRGTRESGARWRRAGGHLHPDSPETLPRDATPPPQPRGLGLPRPASPPHLSTSSTTSTTPASARALLRPRAPASAPARAVPRHVRRLHPLLTGYAAPSRHKPPPRPPLPVHGPLTPSVPCPPLARGATSALDPAPSVGEADNVRVKRTQRKAVPRSSMAPEPYYGPEPGSPPPPYEDINLTEAERAAQNVRRAKIALIDEILNEENLYKLLGVGRTAKIEEIRRGFLMRSRVCHPECVLPLPLCPLAPLACRRTTLLTSRSPQQVP